MLAADLYDAAIASSGVPWADRTPALVAVTDPSHGVQGLGLNDVPGRITRCCPSPGLVPRPPSPEGPEGEGCKSKSRPLNSGALSPGLPQKGRGKKTRGVSQSLNQRPPRLFRYSSLGPIVGSPPSVLIPGPLLSWILLFSIKPLPRSPT